MNPFARALSSAAALLMLSTPLFAAGDPPTSSAKIRYGNQWAIPDRANPRPDDEALNFYLKRYLDEPAKFGKIASPGSDKPREFKTNTRESAHVTRLLATTAMFSVLMYEKGAVSVDQMAATDRFQGQVHNGTPLYSMSMGKSVVGYLLGHAICAGHIRGVDQKLSDWDLVKNTLYENQSLHDLMSMRAGDQAYVASSNLKTGQNVNVTGLGAILNGPLRESKKGFTAPFNYNDLPPNLVLNYIAHKTGKDFNAFFTDVFREKVRVKDEVFFLSARGVPAASGPAVAIFYATRHDYLRIAETMLEDWNANNCVGQYLKALYKDRRAKDNTANRADSPMRLLKSYGGFFHMDSDDLGNRPVFTMLGHGGQNILIDFERGKILTVHSVHQDYDWRAIILSMMRDGVPN